MEQDNREHNNNGSAEPKGKLKKEMDKKQKTEQGFDANTFLGLVKKYKTYIAAGVLFLAVVLALVSFTGTSDNNADEPVQQEEQQPEQTKDLGDISQEFQVDAIPEVNALIADYYSAYQEGDVKTLKKLAKPVTDKEKSYIKMFSKYVDSYDNISCYTKAGLSEGEYVVSVYLEMKFQDVDTAAPGLDFFYLRTDEDGVLYIDNAYSTFNQSKFMEISTQADVQAYINEFEQGEDVAALQTDVQEKYEQAIEEDAKLSKMAHDTIPDAISAWVQGLSQKDDKDSEKKNEDTETDSKETSEKGTDKDTNTDKDTDEESDKTSEEDENSTGDKKTDESDAQEKKDDASKKDTDTTDEKNTDGKAKTAYAMDGINLRKKPSTDAKVLTQIMLGDELKIYPATEENGWVKAKYKKKTGYVKREFVTTKRSKVPSGTTETENQAAKALPEGKSITLSESVNVRVSMSETADRVGLAFKGDTVKVIQSYAEGWTKVEWNGQTGYIKTDLIK